MVPCKGNPINEYRFDFPESLGEIQTWVWVLSEYMEDIEEHSEVHELLEGIRQTLGDPGKHPGWEQNSSVAPRTSEGCRRVTWRGKNKKIRDFGEQVGDPTESQEAGPWRWSLRMLGPVAEKLEWVVGNHDAECPGEGGGSRCPGWGQRQYHYHLQQQQWGVRTPRASGKGARNLLTSSLRWYAGTEHRSDFLFFPSI